MNKHFWLLLLLGAASLLIVVKGYSAPVITGCPTNITQSLTSGCTSIVNWIEPIANDPNGISSFTSNIAPGSVFNAGRTTVIYTAINGLGEVSVCSFVVRIDLEPENALTNCPSDVTINVNASCNRLVAWVPPTINCGINLSSNFNPGDQFPIGTTTVTYVASLGVDIYAICMFDVTVNDNIAPTFSVIPTDITVAADDECEAVVNWTIPTVVDNCTSGIVPTSPFSSGDTFPIGTTLVTYSAEDEAGNPATDSFTITVEDQTPPEFTNLPSDVVVTADAATCETIVSWPEVLATDNCSSTIVIDESIISGSTFSLGVTEVTYTATDEEGNDQISSFSVTVIDDTAPSVVNCPGDITIDANAGCTAIAFWSPPIFDDSCDPTLLISNSHTSGDVFPIGTTTVTITAADDAGNETSCIFDVIVADNMAPTFSVTPNDITVAADDECEAVASWTIPTVVDNCTTGIVPTSSFSSGDSFPIGTTLVTYSAQDEAGNLATDSFNVIVEDNVAPAFTNFTSDIVVTADGGTCEAIVSWPAVLATDNCSATIVIDESLTSGSSFNLGITEVTYSATDEAGNAEFSSFTVTVTDGTAPSLISCPDDLTIEASADCTAIASWSSPIFDDSCDPSLLITNSHASGDEFPIGTTTVTITAADGAGNETTCTFDVTVADNISPVFIDCRADLTVFTGNGCDAVANWSAPTVSDNCTQDIVPTANFNSGDTFPIGLTEVIYTAEDIAGNQVSCSFNVIVVDQTAPVLNNCPADIEIEADDTCSAIASWSAPTASDNCDTTVTITESHASGSSFELGTTAITYIATDEAGNSTSCSFNVTVVDRTGPEISNCSSDIELTTDGCETIVNWEEILTIDNCSSVSSTSNFESGDSFSLGTTTVVYTFTDEVGNESQCSFNVTVTNPNDLIVSNCPQDIAVETGENGMEEVSWDEPSALSSCSEITAIQSHQPGDTFSVGTTLVTYEFMDEFERVVTCSFSITVSVRDIEFDIPKLLTPNNDGNNDTWTLSGLENFPDNEVVIVDRWGGEIFKASGYDNQQIVWDGSNQNGNIVPTGTYFFYILVKTDAATEKKQGFIELVR